MGKFKNRKIYLSAIILLFISILVYSGSKIFKNINEVKPLDLEVFNPVTDEDKKIDGTDFVTFDAFFLSDEDGDGQAEGYHGISLKNRTSQKIYFELNITGDITLKEGNIEFENNNVNISGSVPRSALFSKTTYRDSYTNLLLNDVGNGVSSFFSLNTSVLIDKKLGSFESANKIILTGIVENNITHEQTPIRKEVIYNVNSYAENIRTYYETAKVTADTADRIVVHYTLNTTESYNEMPILESHIEGSVSQLAGADPKRVTIRSQNYGDVIEYDYNAVDLTFTAVKRAKVENGVITEPAYNYTSYGRNITVWNIDVEYEYDPAVFGEIVSLTTSAWHTGVKNQNGVTQDSEKKVQVLSQEIIATSQGYGDFVDESRVYIGDYIDEGGNNRYYFVDKTPLSLGYEGEEIEDTLFDQRWQLDMKIAEDASGRAIFKDSGIVAGGRNISSYVTYESMNVSSGSYYARDQILTVYNDETDEVLFVIDKDHMGSRFNFPANVHKVRIESNMLDANSTFKYTVYFKRKIDNHKLVRDFTVTTFNPGNISNTMRVWAEWKKGDTTGSTGVLPHSNDATFREQQSFVSISTDKHVYEKQISDQTIPMEVYLSTNGNGTAYRKWKDGIFLLEVPDILIDEEIVSATSGSFDILSVEKVKIGNKKFIKIFFSPNKGNILTSPIVETTGGITLKMNAILNPKQSDASGTFKLYGLNTNRTLYRDETADIYDINSNGDTTEKITSASAAFNITVPSEIITGSSITDIDDQGTTVVSPLVADVNPLRGSSDATMNIFVLNNSNNNINKLSIIGKTGFVGNTYQVGDGDLGTEFDSYMGGPITYDPSLDGIVTIYYSDKETPTSDLTDLSNNWMTTPSDYSLVKSYMILFDESYILNVDSEVDFNYPIKLPTNTTPLNKVSYYTHGAYFDYITEAGNYSSNASSGKLGIRMARKFSLSAELFKKYSDNIKLSGGTYKLVNKNRNDDVRVLAFDNNGNASVNGLYINETYEISQIAATNTTVMENVIRDFKINNNNDDSLSLYWNGLYRNISYDSSNNIVNLEFENDVKFNLTINNTDIDSGAPVDTIYKLTGPGFESGKYIYFDENGTTSLNNLIPNEVYKIEQVANNDYVKTKTFEFKVVRDLEDHTFDVTTRQAPTITRSGSCDSRVTTSTSQFYDSSQKKYIDFIKLTNNKEYPSSQTDISCLLTLNLAGYKDDYTVKVQNASVYDAFLIGNSTLDFSVSRNMNYFAAPAVTVTKDPDYDWYDDDYLNNASNSFDISTSSTYESGTPNIISTNITGGDNHMLLVNFHRSATNVSSSVTPYYTVNRIYLKHNGSDIEELYQNKTKSNVVSSDNSNVTQTISNYAVNATSNPMLTLNIKNKEYIKNSFEITKVDAETGDPLPNAMFRINGPGIPADTIIKTDDNGKATITLSTSLAGGYSSIPGIGSNTDYPLSSVYTIQEIIAPDGYTINSKQISFKIVAKYDYNAQPESYYIDYTSNNSFDEDNTGTDGVFRATMSDYPLFKITKKDYETGEVLPNTYYSIYLIDPVTGDLTEAKNIYGSIVGDKTTIDGVNYYLVKTDEHGEIVLPLNSGTYKLVEVLAADEKYDITDNVTYFSVGESSAYQAKGAKILEAARPDVINQKPANTSSTRVYAFPTYMDTEGNVITVEFDGYYSSYEADVYLVKYNSNLEKVWKTKIPYEDVVVRDKLKYIYFDSDRGYEMPVEESEYKRLETFIIDENDDSYFFFTGGLSEYRFDKETGQMLHDASSDRPRTIEFTDICDKEAGTDYTEYEYLLIPNDDEHVYCNASVFKFYNDPWGPSGLPEVFSANNSGTVKMYNIRSGNTNYGIQLSDGTLIENPFVGEDSKYGYAHYILKNDLNGNLIDAINISSIVNEEIYKYMVKNNMDTTGRIYWKYSDNGAAPMYSSQIKYFNDGSLIILISTGSLYTESGNFYGNLSFAIKLDANNNVVFFTPVGYNGMGADQYGYRIGQYNKTYWHINDDGSFDAFVNFSGGIPLTRDQVYSVSPNNPFYQNDDLYIEVQKTEYEIATNKEKRYGQSFVMVHFDNKGKLQSNVWPTNTAESCPPEYENEGYYHHSPRGFEPQSVMRTNDGYIVVATFRSNYYEGSTKNWFYLANGEKYTLPETDGYYRLYVYKVNDNNEVEWIKEYLQGIYTADSYTSGGTPLVLTNLRNNQFTISFLTNESWIKDVNAQEAINVKNPDGNPKAILVKFEVSDEVIPEAPAAVNLELFNSRKEFKVTLHSNNDTDGIFKIHAGTNPEYIGLAPGDVENVKFGDSSVSNITAVPNSGFYVKNVTVNGKEMIYQTDLDGTVHLSKFDDVREDKDIYVEFARSSSRVLVHHYLENTTVSIAPDDTFIGEVGDRYTTFDKMDENYDLVKDANGDYIYPTNYIGTFDVSPIEVTYYYTSIVNLRVNYYQENTDNKLAPSQITRNTRGSSYSTSPLSIPRYVLSSILGDESGFLNNDLTEVSYFYNRNVTQTMVTTRFVDIDTNRDISNPVYDYYDPGLTYSTQGLLNIPENYVYHCSSGNESGPIGTEEVTVIYYYKKKTGRVTTYHLDDITHDPIAGSTYEDVYYGNTYNTYPLTNIPEEYNLVSTPTNANGTVGEDVIDVIYLYHKNPAEPTEPDKGNVYTKYLDVDSNDEIAPTYIRTYNYGDVYQAKKLEMIPEGYKYVKVVGKEEGTVNSKEIVITYYYQKETAKPENNNKEQVPNPVTNDNILSYVTLLTVSVIGLIGLTIYKKKRN